MKKSYSLITVFIFALQAIFSGRLNAQCVTPTGLSATNITTAGVYLNANSTTTSVAQYNIRYHTSFNTTWTVLEHVILPYQLGNLSCNTAYEWQVQRICDLVGGTTSVSDWSVGAAFTTAQCTTPPPSPCLTPTGLLSYDVTQTTAYLHLGTTTTNSMQYNIRYHTSGTTTWTIVEHVTLPYPIGNLACGTTYEWQAQLVCTSSATGVIIPSDWSTGVTFTTAPCTIPTCNAPTGLTATNVSQSGATLYLSPTSSNTGTFNIRYLSSTSPNWIILEHVTLPYQLGNLACSTVYEWQAQLICTSTPGTTLTTVSPWSAGGAFTTLACTVTPCNAPTGLSATNVGQTGATLYLTPTSNNVGTFNIRYHGANVTTWTTLEHVTLPYQLGNLACSTVYEWQAQLICTSTPGTTLTTVSPWSAGGAFTTLACT
ncbi:hypothetical protein, partial [Flavobacterium sp.]|uniref:hypothetical protein n=1 Tax=Flavobacterium sp. TaxID=239 RepID=UPI0025E4B2A8